MAIVKIGRSHRAKKQLFQRGLRRGFLTIQEIETSLPPGSLTAAERWLLYYSLRAAEIEIRDESGAVVTVPSLTPEELEQLTRERMAEPPPAVQAGAEPEGEPQASTAGNGREPEQAEEALAAVEEHPADHH